MPSWWWNTSTRCTPEPRLPRPGALVYTAALCIENRGADSAMTEINALRNHVEQLQGRVDDLRGYL